MMSADFVMKSQFFFVICCIVLSCAAAYKIDNGACDVVRQTAYQLHITGPISDTRKTTLNAESTEACSVLCCENTTCDVALFVNKKCILYNCPNLTMAPCQPVISSDNRTYSLEVDRKNSTLIYIRKRSPSEDDLFPATIFETLLTNNTSVEGNFSLVNESADDHVEFNPTLTNDTIKQILNGTAYENNALPLSKEMVGLNQNIQQINKASFMEGSSPPVTISTGHSRTLLTPLSNDSVTTEESDLTVTSDQTNIVTARPVDDEVTDSEEAVTEVHGNITESSATTPVETTTVSVTEGKRRIAVSISGITEIRLPQDSVELTANVDEESRGPGYDYDWQLIKQPKEYKGKERVHEERLTLSTLAAGNYQFKVTVKGENAYGEGYVNVSVLEPLRVNQPPVAKISPAMQEVVLPNDKTVLDGTGSRDDDGIASYHWEILERPLPASEKQEVTDNGKLLQLDGLVEGEYEVELTVTDRDGATNTTTAFITVKPPIDNKPIANAGSNQLIHLPQNEVFLHGNGSSDDHGIVSYKWMLSPESSSQVVDMQGVRTATLKLSNFEAGEYTFILTVTDAKGQEDSATVSLNVQPESNHPPVADAGQDSQALLPPDEAGGLPIRLDGSKSSDDKELKTVEWQQKSGPSSKIETPNSLITRVSGISAVGSYVFTLTVGDSEGETSSNDVTITVMEEKSPSADAGPDKTLQLPDDVIVLDGGNSHDDYGIKSFHWSRDSASPASGRVFNHSDDRQRMIVSGLTEGIYTFHLHITNIRGKKSSDTVIVKVLPDPHLNIMVEMHLSASPLTFDEASKKNIAEKIPLFLSTLNNKAEVLVSSVYHEHSTGDVVVLFVVVLPDRSYLPALAVVNTLNDKLKSGVSLFDAHVKYFDTYVCENECSGHGKCHSGSKKCECDVFWMENFLRVYMGDGGRNCDWSVLYVAIISFLIAAVLVGIIYSLICLCMRRRGGGKSRNKRRKRNYIPLQNGEHEKIPLNKTSLNKNGFRKPFGTNRTTSLMRSLTSSSSSDESDTLYEKRKLIGAPPKRTRARKAKKVAPLVELVGSHVNSEEGAFDGLGLDKEVALHGGGAASSDDIV